MKDMNYFERNSILIDRAKFCFRLFIILKLTIISILKLIHFKYHYLISFLFPPNEINLTEMNSHVRPLLKH